MLSEGGPFRSRTVAKKAMSYETPEGRGVVVHRSIGTHVIRNFDPFLVLDEITAGLPGGFPDHPHRGFEMINYMLPDSEGGFHHEDSVGHEGELHPGDLQWMTAGRGVLHSEMPDSRAHTHGIQLWVNLSAKDKMTEPDYQEVPAAKMPQTSADGVTVRVLVGSSLGVSGHVQTRTPLLYLHFTLAPRAHIQQSIPTDWNALIFTLRGRARFGDIGENAPVTDHHSTLLLSECGDGLLAAAADHSSCEFLLIAGQPLHEPIIQSGPFVMNNHAEIAQAWSDFYNATNGFEGAPQWSSKYGNDERSFEPIESCSSSSPASAPLLLCSTLW